MQVFSWLSYCCTLLGLLLFGLDWVIYAYVQSLVLAGVAALAAGAVFSVVAFLKKEKSGLKYISLLTVVGVWIFAIWMEPPGAITVFAWLENLI